MQYRELIQKAYHITINNPILWVFGLFLSAGFNLNMIYIGSFGWDKPGELLQNLLGIIRQWPFASVSGGVVIIVITFLVSTFIKTFFVTEAHLRIHNIQDKTCPLCVSQIDQHTLRQRMPRYYSIGKIAIASAVTIIISLATAGLLNFVVAQSAYGHNPSVISLSALASIIIICGIGCWNVFTVLFILWYSRSFQAAAQLSLGLLSSKTKQITECIILLVVMYGALVVVGSVLIILSQFSFTALFAPLQHSAVPEFVLSIIRILATIAFWVWLSISNVFFNICLFLFFDDLVKPVSKEAPVEIIQGLPT